MKEFFLTDSMHGYRIGYVRVSSFDQNPYLHSGGCVRGASPTEGLNRLRGSSSSRSHYVVPLCCRFGRRRLVTCLKTGLTISAASIQEYACQPRNPFPSLAWLSTGRW